MGILIYFSVVLVLLLGVINVLVLTPIVFAGRAPYQKVYLLWSIYVSEFILRKERESRVDDRIIGMQTEIE